MRIIIVGEGRVFYRLAEHLSVFGHDAVLIERNPEPGKSVENHNFKCLKGSGANVAILKEAGIANADLLIASTTSDEFNLVCCTLGKTFGARYTLARVRDKDYLDELAILQNTFALNLAINPDQTSAAEIARMLCFPPGTSVGSFAWGKVELIRIILSDSPLVGRSIAGLQNDIPRRLLFVKVERDGETLVPKGDFIFKDGDIISVIGEFDSLVQMMRFLGKTKDEVKDIIIIGGGRIANYLYRVVSGLGIKARILEASNIRYAEIIAEFSPENIIHGNGLDKDLLNANGITETDAVICLTNKDEDNIFCALYALDSGVKKVIARFKSSAHSESLQGIGLLGMINYDEIAVRQILKFIAELESDMASSRDRENEEDETFSIREFIAAEDTNMIGMPLKQLPLKDGVLLAVLVRGGRIIFPAGKDAMQPGDIVIAVSEKHTLNRLEDIYI